MGWIKRNLFFAIGSVIALALLGAAGFYNFKSWRHNHAALDKLKEAYGVLEQLNSQNPSPGNDKVNNIDAAREQERQLRQWIAQAQAYFEPVPPIPNPPDGVVTTEEFARSLSRTIDQLHHEADDASVTLPPDYGFSFAAERNRVTFAPGSLNQQASHLGDVKAICDILFAAKVNALDGIQREIVSDDDAAGPQSDYLADKTVTTDLATITPYIITFRCFTADLANVMSALASSNHGFVVKAINVLPAGEAAAATGGNPMMPGGASPPAYAPPVERGGLQTVRDEQLLRVTLAIEVVKLAKK